MLTETALTAFLEPRGICVIGASPRGGYGRRVVEALVRAGYGGALIPVHPNAEIVAGLQSVRNVAAIQESITLAIVAVSAENALAVLRDCVGAGIGAAIVFSSGFAETGSGHERDEELRRLVQDSGLRLLGPNCLGVINWSCGLNATPMSLERPESASLGLISQSGAVALSNVVPRAAEWGIGFAKILSTGNELDIGVAECIDSYVEDPGVSTICAIVESVRRPDAFRLAVRHASQAGKRVIVLKVGRSQAGARAARSHTGGIVGRWEVERASLEADGAVIVDSPDALWRVAASLDGQARTRGRRVFVLSTSGGLNGLISDALSSAGADIMPLADKDKPQFGRLLPHYASVDNPLDLTGGVVGADDEPSVFAEAALAGAEAIAADAVAVGITVPRPELIAELKRVQDALRASGRPVHLLPVYIGRQAFPDGTGEVTLRDAGLVAAGTMEGLVAHWQGFLSDARSGRAFAASPSWSAAEACGAVAEHDAEAARLWADPWKAAERLRSLGVPLAPAVEVTAEESVPDAVVALGLPVVVKSLAPGLYHKSDVGAVALDNVSVAEARLAYARVSAAADCPRVMLQRQSQPGLDLLVSIRREEGLGLILVIGLGGVAVEVLRKYLVIAQPFTPERVRAALDESDWSSLLRAFRGRPARDTESLVRTCLGLSNCISHAPAALREIECNPIRVFAQDSGCEVLDVKCYTDDEPEKSGEPK